MPAFPPSWRNKLPFPPLMKSTIFTLLSDLAAGVLKATVFVSAEITGTGSSQSTAHSLSTAPSLAFIIPSDLTGGAFTVTYGTNTTANCVGTVTSGEKYRWIAIK